MTTKSKAIEQLAAIKNERDRLQAEAQAINAKAAPLNQQLAQLESAAADDAQAVTAATAALAAALETGDQEAITEARNRAAAASKAESKASARQTEIAALRAAIAALSEKTRPIGQRLMELHAQEKTLAGQRLSEIALDDLRHRYRDKMHELAVIVAEAQALNLIAMQADHPGNYAPPPFALPSLVGESICESGRVAIDLAPMRDKARAVLVERLHAEGFAGV